ncbi:MAG: YbgC/YbaW family acyl-CoA thioester hydrolase [Gammaproteobacteria bacterium]|jgi:YbgC/YbaW family acyl-CoA thioester hydrolase
MYPYLKLAITLLRSLKRSKLSIDELGVIQCRVGFTDIDPFMELNHARQLIYMELGRWDFSYRTGFLNLLKQKGWGLTVGGISIRYRRRVAFWQRFSVTTRVVCHDGRWFYFLQEIIKDEKICSSALIKAGAVSKQGLVPAIEALEAVGQGDWGHVIPDWVQAWIDAEGQRPWPK